MRTRHVKLPLLLGSASLIGVSLLAAVCFCDSTSSSDASSVGDYHIVSNVERPRVIVDNGWLLALKVKRDAGRG